MSYFTGSWQCEGRGPRPWTWTFAPALDNQAYTLHIVEPSGRSDGADVLVDVTYVYQPVTNSVFDVAVDNLGKFEINRGALFDGKTFTLNSLQTNDGSQITHAFTVAAPNRFSHHVEITTPTGRVIRFDQTCTKP